MCFFSRSGLGNSLYAANHRVGAHSTAQLQQFVAKHFTTGRTALVGVGIQHASLAKVCFVYTGSVPDPEPYGFGPSGSGSQRYRSWSFHHQAKLLRKTFISIVLWLPGSISGFYAVPSNWYEKASIYKQIRGFCRIKTTIITISLSRFFGLY